MPKKILFIGPHRPSRNGSQRFRMEQFFPYFREKGFECDYSWFIDEQSDKIFYKKGNWIGKFFLLLKAVKVRLLDILHANKYDIIFVQREAFMMGSTFFERQFSKSKAKLIFDFDDSIWLSNISVNNKRLKWLTRPSKTADIIKMSDWIFAGNKYLANYAEQYNKNITIVPTVIDTDIYLPIKKGEDKIPICIGWSGSKTTVEQFEPVVPILRKLKERYGEKVCFKQIGDKNFKVDGLVIESDDWHFYNEVPELNKIDIGLMPLPDDKWSRGKCGFKALQYMALEIPPVVSPVGVNTDIVKQGENGFIAKNDDEWLRLISMLIDSYDLRRKMGLSARKTVVEEYSVQSQVSRMVDVFNNLIDKYK